MKKTLTLLFLSLALVFTLTGCCRSDIGITLNNNGTGTVAASFGIEKAAYEQFKTMGADIFEGKTTTEQQYGGTTYVTCTETEEYSSYADIKNALLELTYNTEKPNQYEDAEAEPDFDSSEYNLYTPEKENKDDHIFTSVALERSSGIFYSVCTFRATVNPPAIYDKTNNTDTDYKVTVTVNMPDRITQSKGGSVDGHTITFDLSNITGPTEIAAVSESNHYGTVLFLCGGFAVIAAVMLVLIKRKK